MNKPQQTAPSPDFSEHQSGEDLKSLNDAGLGEVIDATEAEGLLNTLTESAVTIPLSRNHRTVIRIQFESEEWMRVFAYLPENGNRGYIWIGNIDEPAKRAWVIAAGYSLVKIEIDYWHDGDWKPSYPTIHPPPRPIPDPTVRVCGKALGSEGCDVNVFVFPTAR